MGNALDKRRARLETYLNRLYGYALSLAGDRDQARDLVQDCALRATAARRSPIDEPAYRAWLFRILRNAYLDQERRAGRTQSLSDDEDQSPGDTQVWRFDESLISALTVRIGLARISVAHREIITLVDLVGFTYAETAELIGVAPGTVMSRLSRARQALLQAITKSNVQPLPVGTGTAQARKLAK